MQNFVSCVGWIVHTWSSVDRSVVVPRTCTSLFGGSISSQLLYQVHCGNLRQCLVAALRPARVRQRQHAGGGTTPPGTFTDRAHP